MQPVSAVALFCEDIREEKSEQDSIVGILPDNLQVAALPGSKEGGTPLFPKLGVYLRLHLSPHDKPKDVSVKVINTDGVVVVRGGWDQAIIDKAFDDGAKSQTPLVGLIQKMVLSPFPFPKSGRVLAIAIVDGIEYVAATLNVIVLPATASERPALQSPSAAPASS